MAWFLVVVAGIFEVVFAVSLKNSEGFTRPPWVIAFILASVVSFALLSQGLKYLPVSVAYAVWTGIGAVGTAAVGMLWLGESRDLLRIVSILIVIVGVIGLQLSSSSGS